MKVLLFGMNGLLGKELKASLALFADVIAIGREQINLEHEVALRVIIKKTKPDWIINAAAYTMVDEAEVESKLAFMINCDAVKIIAEEAMKISAGVIHYSTDYVYDGRKKGMYVETDEVNPLSVYGASKLAGENAIREANPLHFIFRISWLYGLHGNSFPRTILKLAKNKAKLSVISDQIGSPTSAKMVADATAYCLKKLAPLSYNERKALSGVYHIAPKGSTTWFDFAKFVMSGVKERGGRLLCSENNLLPISSEDYRAAAIRPLNSTLNASKFESTFEFRFPHWALNVECLLNMWVTCNIINSKETLNE